MKCKVRSYRIVPYPVGFYKEDLKEKREVHVAWDEDFYISENMFGKLERVVDLYMGMLYTDDTLKNLQHTINFIVSESVVTGEVSLTKDFTPFFRCEGNPYFNEYE